MIGNQCLLLVFSFSLSLSQGQVPALPVAALCLPRRVEERADVEGNDHWHLCHSEEMQVNGRLVTASGDTFLPALPACEGDAVYGTHWSALQPETLCSTVFKIFQNAQSQQKESRDSNTKRPQGSQQQCLCQRNLACLNCSSWADCLFPLSSPLSFFSSWFPTTSWGLSHCGLYFLSTMKHRDTFHSFWAHFLLGIWLSKGELFVFVEFTHVYTASDLHTKKTTALQSWVCHCGWWLLPSYPGAIRGCQISTASLVRALQNNKMDNNFKNPNGWRAFYKMPHTLRSDNSIKINVTALGFSYGKTILELHLLPLISSCCISQSQGIVITWAGPVSGLSSSSRGPSCCYLAQHPIPTSADTFRPWHVSVALENLINFPSQYLLFPLIPAPALCFIFYLCLCTS